MRITLTKQLPLVFGGIQKVDDKTEKVIKQKIQSISLTSFRFDWEVKIMNRRHFLNTGDMVIGRFITTKQLGHVHTNPEQELTRILRTFSYKDILVTLARINLLFHRSANLLSDERKLKEAYCSIPMLNKIDGEIGNSFLFHRQATLRLLNKCACVAGLDSERTFDRNDALNDFAKSYLLVSELLEAESSAQNMTGDKEKKDLLVKSFEVPPFI